MPETHHRYPDMGGPWTPQPAEPEKKPSIELSFFANDLTGKPTPVSLSIPTSATKNIWTLFAAAAVGALAARLLDPRNQDGDTSHGQPQ